MLFVSYAAIRYFLPNSKKEEFFLFLSPHNFSAYGPILMIFFFYSVIPSNTEPILIQTSPHYTIFVFHVFSNLGVFEIHPYSHFFKSLIFGIFRFWHN